MGNRVLCPACDSYTSSGWQARQDGEPCPHCGLPALVGRMLEHHAAKGADQALVKMAAEASAAAAKAELELARLRSRINNALFELGGGAG